MKNNTINNTYYIKFFQWLMIRVFSSIMAMRFHLIAIAFLLLLLSVSAFAGLDIETVYLYDLKGPTLTSKLRENTDLFCDFERSEIYVVDTMNHCIRIFGKDGIQLFQFGSDGSLSTPLNVAVSSNGDIFVIEGGYGGRRIEVFDYRGEHLDRIELKGLPEGEIFLPMDIAINSKNNIFLSNPSAGSILVFNSNGEYLYKIVPEMSEKEREEVIFGNLLIDKEDKLYVPVRTLGAIYVFDSDGEHIMGFGMQGGGPGKLAAPVDIVIDKHGHFLVLDHLRHCISVYDREGRYLTEFGGMGTAPGWFFYPSHLEIDKYGRIYVSQRFRNKVQVLKVKEVMQ
jgi:DNA-binding beta-propeller fold protein YncE